MQAKAQLLWLWEALCFHTRQVAAWILGDRSLQGAYDLRTALLESYWNRATHSVYWGAYAAAFPKERPTAAERTQREKLIMSNAGLAPVKPEFFAYLQSLFLLQMGLESPRCHPLFYCQLQTGDQTINIGISHHYFLK